MTVRILTGDCRAMMRTLPDDSVHMAMSSPPYWGLRSYGVEPTLWGGDPDCEHEFFDETLEREVRKGMGLEELGKRYRGGGKKHGKIASFTIHRGTCVKCGCWRGDLGLEPTPEMFIEHMVEVFEEVRRVLRPDGTLWLNIGDSYASGGGAGEQGRSGDRFERAHTQKYLGVNRGSRSVEASGKHGATRKVGSNRAQRGDGNDGVPFAPAQQPNRSPIAGLKPKDIVGVPWMLAFALRGAGWWLRQDIIWEKPNPMPESIEDRCTKAHEYLFLLAKSEAYYYDADAIKEAPSENSNPRGTKLVTPKSAEHGSGVRANDSFHASTGLLVDKRNKRSVWTVEEQDSFVEPPPEPERVPWNRPSVDKGGFGGKRGDADNVEKEQAFRAIRESRNKRSVWTIATTPYPEAHFATFPPALVEPCVMAGTSERGCCPDCAKPWRRITAPSERYAQFLGRSYHDHDDDLGKGQMQQRGENRQNAMKAEAGITTKETETIGWYPECDCAGLPPLPKLPPPPRLRTMVDPDTGQQFDVEPNDPKAKAALEERRAEWRKACVAVHNERRPLCEAAKAKPTVPAVVLDPFGGSGTTGMVANRLQRDAVLCELNAKYAGMAVRRIEGDGGLFARVAAE